MPPQCFRHGTVSLYSVSGPPLIFVSVVSILIGRYAPHSETPDTAGPTSEEQPADKQPKSVTLTALFFLLFFGFSLSFSVTQRYQTESAPIVTSGDFEHNGEEQKRHTT